MAPSNALVIHMEEKLLPKEKNKVSRAPERIGKAGLPLANIYDMGEEGEVAWGKANMLNRDKGDYIDF